MTYLLNSLIPDDNEENETALQKTIRIFAEEEYQTMNDCPFTMIEVKAVIQAQNAKTTPGIDRIPVLLLQKVFEFIPNDFLKVFNLCLKFGHFPKQWKIASVIVFLKSNDCNKENPSSYRPISLLSNLAKILEKLISNRISYYFHKNNLLSDN
jgi:hypothetical protein